jgi:hypothetical protein
VSDIIFQEAKNFIEKAKNLGDKYVGRTAEKEEIQLLKDKFSRQNPQLVL